MKKAIKDRSLLALALLVILVCNACAHGLAPGKYVSGLSPNVYVNIHADGTFEYPNRTLGHLLGGCPSSGTWKVKGGYLILTGEGREYTFGEIRGAGKETEILDRDHVIFKRAEGSATAGVENSGIVPWGFFVFLAAVLGAIVFLFIKGIVRIPWIGLPRPPIRPLGPEPVSPKPPVEPVRPEPAVLTPLDQRVRPEPVSPKPPVEPVRPEPAVLTPLDQRVRPEPVSPKPPVEPTIVEIQPTPVQVQPSAQGVIPVPVVTKAGEEPTAPATKAKLVVTQTGRVGQEFSITKESVDIGRWDAESQIFPEIDLTQDDPGTLVSRRHARIFFKDGKYYIEDMGSTNGTFINRGPRLVPGVQKELKSGDEILVGHTFLKFVA